jgi:CHAT domain-containing protein/Tfp pilus assembly protein PilF
MEPAGKPAAGKIARPTTLSGGVDSAFVVGVQSFFVSIFSTLALEYREVMLIRPGVVAAAVLCACVSGAGQTMPTPRDGGIPCAELKPGVVVEAIAKNSQGAKAGLAEGDTVLVWIQGDRRGDIGTPFDLTAAEIEMAPRGAATLEGTRGASRQRWVLGPGSWGIGTRPNVPENLLTIYGAGRELLRAGKAVEAAGQFRIAAAQAMQSRCAWLGSWMLFRAAETLASARQWKESDESFQEVLAQATVSSPAIKSQLLQAWAGTFSKRGDWAGAEKHYGEAVQELQGTGSEGMGLAKALSRLGTVEENRAELEKAEKYYRQALAIRERIAPGSLAVAASRNDLGNIAFGHADLAEAEESYGQALAIQQKLAPGSLDLAASLNNLGLVAHNRGDLAKAEEYYSQALVIDDKLAPGSDGIAADFNNLGLIAEERGDLAKAENYYRQALTIKQKLSPGSLGVARSLNNLANVADERGDLAKAEGYHRQALSIFQTQTPGSGFVAASLHNLGEIAFQRGDLDKAEEYHRQALAIREKATPGGLSVAFSLVSLGNIAFGREDLAKAEEYHRRALAIREKQAPGSLDVAASLNELGNVVDTLGNSANAEQYLQRALAIFEKLGPGSLNMAATANNLGDMARRRKDLATAEAYYRQALKIRKTLAPESTDAAESLASLAGVMRERGQLDSAGELFREALNALEGQTARLGGDTEVRSGFRAKHAGYYAEYLDLLMSQKQPELAFQVLERSRARTMLETLSEAHLDIRQGADPSLLEQEGLLRAELRAKTNRRIELAEGKHTEEQAAVNNEINALLAQYGEIQGRIRTTSPKYAALTQPQPLTAQAVQRQLLDADSVLLEYALGERRSYVFALTPTTLDAYELPKREEIESAAQRVYDLLTTPNRWSGGESGEQRNKRIAAAQAEYWTAAGKLSRMVLAPVAARLKGKRLLIVSDGLLQYIPFATLPVGDSVISGDSGDSQRDVPLVAEHEVVHLPSASVLAVLRQEQARRGAGPPKTVAVLADPVFDRNDGRVVQAKNRGQAALPKTKMESPLPVDDRLTRSVGDVGLAAAQGSSLPRLAFSRREAAAIMALTEKGQGLEALDFQASRETASSPELAQYRIVHFATHGLLDNKHPELSGLVLSLVDEGGNARNGFLDLEDVYNLKLPVDLVVLSACETGLGKQMGTEGLVGLTRGFMYAGAPRVLASLWKVDDVATAKLMESFYRGMLKEGKRPAAALRQAQLEMWAQQRWAAPYYWGAFSLQGEWR